MMKDATPFKVAATVVFAISFLLFFSFFFFSPYCVYC